MKNVLFAILQGDCLLIDMHVHTVYSGHGSLRVNEIFKIYKTKGIVPAITEHNTAKPWKEAEHFSKKYSLPFIKGEEIKVYHNAKLVGELLGLFMNEEIAPGSIFEVIDRLHEQQAMISVAHPFDVLRKPFFKGFTMLEQIRKKVDAIEVFNSRCYFSAANKKAKEFADRNNMPFTAGTDAHFANELGNAFMIIDASSLEEARKKILAKKCSYWGKPSSKIVHLYTQLAKLGFFRQ
ncbi:MAG: PHP domain-containing protein [Candidatus Diapherotrites archaeon]|nr:PHP domain-containing protein [Candidatus Diapherotrites archaeon]